MTDKFRLSYPLADFFEIMSAPVLNLKDYRVTVRLTENERRQLLRLMERDGYISMSKYFRTVCLNRKYSDARDTQAADAEALAMVKTLSNEIVRIGEGYNQTVRGFRQVLEKRRKDGNPVINTKAATLHLQTLNMLTLEVRALMEHIMGIFDNSKQKNESTE